MPSINHAYRFASILILISIMFIVGCASAIRSPAPNSPPVINEILGSSKFAPSSEGGVECVATDPDGDSLSYQWSTDNGTIKGEGHKITWIAPGTPGIYHVTGKVSDVRGGEVTRTISIVVGVNEGDLAENQTVTLRLSLPSSQTVEEKARVGIWATTDIVCQVENADSSDLNYAWTAMGGKLVGKGLAERKANRVGYVSPGVPGDYTVVVTVSDSKGNQAQGKVNFHILCCGEK